MLPLKTTTALVAGSLLTLSSTALAEGTNQSNMNEHDREKGVVQNDDREWHGGQYGAIDELSDEGNVTLSGTVEGVDEDDNSFQLRDETGETIDVRTASNVTAREGEQVLVEGVIEDEALGIGEQIVSASVQRLR